MDNQKITIGCMEEWVDGWIGEKGINMLMDGTLLFLDTIIKYLKEANFVKILHFETES